MNKSNEWPLWEVFIRGQHGMSHRHVGSLHAVDADHALKNARDVYTRRTEGISIWVVKSQDISASQEDDNESFFDPSDDKPYRHATYYPLPKEISNM